MTEEEMEKAFARYKRRVETFMQEGLCEEGAYDLADQMFERDRDGHDDRRVCFECQNYVGRVCMKMKDKLGKPQMPLRFILQRCDYFQLKGSK
jgi:hypothetical protein